MLQFPGFKKYMKLWSSVVPKLTNTSQSLQFDSLTCNCIGYFVVPNLPTNFATWSVKACEINCNYTYMSVSHLLWNLRNYLSITALCEQTRLPSIISNIEDHKNEIWKTVRLTSFKGPNCHPFQFFLSLSTCYLITPKAIFICTHSCSLLCYLNLLFMFWAVFLCFTEIGGGLHCCSFDKFCDTAPLSS